MAQLEGKVAIVTGAASGIGQATAKEMAEAGAKVVCGDINTTGLEETVAAIKEAGGEAIAVPCDVTSDEQVAAFVQAAIDEYGEIHTVVNVAGIGGFKHTHQTDMAHWSRFIDINLSGTFRVILHALPHVVDTESPITEAKKSRGKAIINVASQAAMKAHPYAAGYCASKGGVLMLTKALAVEYASRGLRVNAVCPGGIKTPILSDFAPLPDGEFALIQRLMPPMQRFGRPFEVGRMIVYLASDDANYVTGESFTIDGGSAL
ncbi:MAG: NAD(P)-dependent dehydrogenase (short-subunit alcohol dehydrogenase family) [Bradymonadia bacterium]|jgi:NAD(P)-dependent dehydrogenase (short-subunit alcohol dehydrogenase family)